LSLLAQPGSGLWDDLSKDEQREIRRLFGKHREIAKWGAQVLERIREKDELQERRQQWVTKHSLSCFKCGSTWNDWAAGGVKNGRKWCICSRWVREKRNR